MYNIYRGVATMLTWGGGAGEMQLTAWRTGAKGVRGSVAPEKLSKIVRMVQFYTNFHYTCGCKM